MQNLILKLMLFSLHTFIFLLLPFQLSLVAKVSKTQIFKKKRKNFMAPFYGWGSTASKLELLQGDSLLFTTKFPETPGTHFVDLERMKG